MRRITLRLVTAATLFSGAAVLASQAMAGDPCDALWYRRNAIYASAGYCFKTPRAISQFGHGCFPPYGQLSAAQQRRVDRIIAKESALGC